MPQPGSLLLIMKDGCGDLAGQNIHIDGKALRGSDSAAAGKAMVHLLRAWMQSAQISAGTGKVIRDYLPKKSIRSKRKLAALDPAFRKRVLSSILHNFNA